MKSSQDSDSYKISTRTRVESLSSKEMNIIDFYFYNDNTVGQDRILGVGAVEESHHEKSVTDVIDDKNVVTNIMS